MLDFSKLTYSSEQNYPKIFYSIRLKMLKPKEPPVPVDRPSSATSNDRALVVNLKRGDRISLSITTEQNTVY